MSPSAAKTRGDKSRCSSVPMSANTPPENVEAVDIVPGHLTEKVWLSMLTQEDGEEVVVETLRKLESTVLEKCYQVYLQKQRVPFTICWARDHLLNVINWRFLEKDDGEDLESMYFWDEDPEPEPCAFDAWAQGSVPVCYSGANSYTPLLQKLLDLHSAESDDLLDPDSQSETSIRVKINRGCLNSNVSEIGKMELTEDLQITSSCLIEPFKTTQRRKQPKPSLCKALPSQPKTQRSRPVESIAWDLITSRPDNINQLTQPCEHINQNIPVVKRLNTANLLQHQVLPEVEVLEPRPLWRTPKLKQNYHNPVRQAAIIPHPDLCRFTNNQKKMQGTQGTEVHDDAKHQNLKSGFASMSDTFPLDTMTLARGVALKDPAAVGNQGEINPAWVAQLPELKPVRNSFLPPLWSLDQLESEQGPRVTSPTGLH